MIMNLIMDLPDLPDGQPVEMHWFSESHEGWHPGVNAQRHMRCIAGGLRWITSEPGPQTLYGYMLFGPSRPLHWSCRSCVIHGLQLLTLLAIDVHAASRSSYH